MFSINAAYDLDPVANLPFEEYEGGAQDASERQKMYQECERRGIALTVMKAFGGGTLLHDHSSPFGKAMTVNQCLQYALDRPAVVSCFIGVNGVDQLTNALEYYKSDITQRDYSFIHQLEHSKIQGACVYCNHCLPCPKKINIAAVHKYLDLYKAGDDIAKEHYRNLERNASHCIFCGKCEKRCPFGVKIKQKMREAKNLEM
jgi:predicted aldo/keto reductase-like oxidoreductase